MVDDWTRDTTGHLNRCDLVSYVSFNNKKKKKKKKLDHEVSICSLIPLDMAISDNMVSMFCH